MKVLVIWMVLTIGVDHPTDDTLHKIVAEAHQVDACYTKELSHSEGLKAVDGFVARGVRVSSWNMQCQTTTPTMIPYGTAS